MIILTEGTLFILMQSGIEKLLALPDIDPSILDIGTLGQVSMSFALHVLTLQG